MYCSKILALLKDDIQDLKQEIQDKDNLLKVILEKAHFHCTRLTHVLSAWLKV